MIITVFAKKRQKEDGTKFTGYIARLTKKDGEKITCSVKFREECGQPKGDKCPMNIIVEKGKANLTSSEYVREDTGLVGTSYTLWVTEWSEGEAYKDTSLDEFED